MSRRTHNEQKKQVKKSAKKLIPAALAIILGLCGVFYLIDNEDVSKLTGADKEDYAGTTAYEPAKEMTVDGKTYVRKKNVKSYLFIGDDARDPSDDDNEGLCDVLMLFVVDKNEKTYTILPIDRNTMAEINCYDSDDKLLAKIPSLQIAYAHGNAYNDLMACNNTVDSVSSLLDDQPINGFYNMNMAGITKLNGLVDGVTVTIEDDLTGDDPALKKGKTVKLTDKQAEFFVRGRQELSDDTNTNRMGRQMTYLEGFRSAFNKKFNDNPDALNDISAALEDYAYTQMTSGDMNTVMTALEDYKSAGILHLEGTEGRDEQDLVTLTLDQDSIDRAVVQLFYREK